MTNTKQISVIIPIYNVEKYLPKCIDSVINQTYGNIEILLINDGSTDNCGLICDHYADKDNRVNVIHKENGGLSSARNVGLSLAEGRYIAFLDSDDWIDPEMYKVLIEALERTGADIAACGFKEVYQNKIIVQSYSGFETIYDKINAINSLFDETKNIRFEVWNKVFKKEIIGDIRFKDRQVFEDVYFDRNVFLKMNSLVYVDKPMHNYLKEREGNTNSHFSDAKLSVFKEFDDFIDELKVVGMVDSSRKLEAFALHTSITLFCGAVQLHASKSTKKKLREEHYKYHINGNSNPYIGKIKSYFFLYFPYLYCKFSKFKNKNL